MKPLSATACLRRGWSGFSRQPLRAAAAFGGLLAIVAGGLVVPWVNFVFLLLFLAPCLGGFPKMALRLADGERIEFRDLRFGFQHYERFLSVVWLGYLMTVFLAAPLLVGLWIARHFASEALVPWVLGGSGLIALNLELVVLHPYLFVGLLAADRPRGVAVNDLLEESARLVAPHRWQLLGQALAFGFLALSGLVVFGVGFALTAPLGGAAFAAQYRWLSRDPVDQRLVKR